MVSEWPFVQSPDDMFFYSSKAWDDLSSAQRGSQTVITIFLGMIRTFIRPNTGSEAFYSSAGVPRIFCKSQ